MEMLDQRAGRSDLGCGGDVFVVPGELVPGGKAGSGKRDLFFRRIVAPIDRGLALSGGACRILDLALVASGSGSLRSGLPAADRSFCCRFGEFHVRLSKGGTGGHTWFASGAAEYGKALIRSIELLLCWRI